MKVKTETITTRTFEAGDIIMNTMYYWVALRLNDGTWRHTNQNDTDLTFPFDDAQVNKFLDDETWTHVGCYPR